MEFHIGYKDRIKRSEFHTSENIKRQLQVKSQMQADLIKAIDELTSVIDSNSDRTKKLSEIIKDGVPVDKKQICQKTIEQYKNLSALATRICELYLILLDVYTYGTFSLLSDNEWDWRAFARHLYTMIYEHSKTVNKQFNDIMRILRAEIEEDYDLSRVNQAKKDFSSFINENSGYAKQIRVNVDAHFDGDFSTRLRLILNLSYSSFIELYYAYNSKMHAFLLELRPVLKKLRFSADTSYHAIVDRVYLSGNESE